MPPSTPPRSSSARRKASTIPRIAANLPKNWVRLTADSTRVTTYNDKARYLFGRDANYYHGSSLANFTNGTTIYLDINHNVDRLHPRNVAAGDNGNVTSLAQYGFTLYSPDDSANTDYACAYYGFEHLAIPW